MTRQKNGHVHAVSRGAWFWAAAMFAAALALYGKTASGALLFDDNAEFIAAAHRLGITHPPGYPLFSLIGKLFSFLPADAFFAINFSSAVVGACAVATAFIFVWRMTGLWSASASTAVLVATARTFWGQAGQAEVYSANVFFLFLVLNLSLDIVPGKKGLRAVTALVLAGVAGVVNHYSITLLVPGAVALSIYVNRKNPRDLLYLAGPAFLIAAIGLSFYMYLPIRSAAAPKIKWKTQTTLKGFIKHAKGVDRRSSVQKVQLSEKAKFVKHYFRLLKTQWTPWTLLFALIGLAGIVWRRWAGSQWLVVHWLVLFVGFIMLLNYLFGPRSAYVVAVFHISSIALVAVFAGLGMGTLQLALAEASLPWQPVMAIFAGLAGWSMVANYEFADNSRNMLAVNLGRNILRNMARDAIIFSRLETESFPIASLRAVGGVRSDIMLLGNQGDVADDRLTSGKLGEMSTEFQDVTGVEEVIMKERLPQRPVYFTFLRRLGSIPGVALYPNGLLYQVNPNLRKLAAHNPWKRIDMSGIDLKYTNYDYIAKNVIGKYYVKMAERLLNERNGEQAKLTLDRVVAFNPGSRFLRMEVAGLYMSIDQLDLAREQYEAALKVESENVELSIDTMSIYNNLSYIYGHFGEREKALEMIETAVRMAPDIPIFLLNLGQTYWELDRCEDAIKALEKAARKGVKSASLHNTLGICYEKTQRLGDAKTHYEKALKMNPNLPEVYRDYGIFNAYSANNPSKAAELLSKYAEMKPDAKDIGVVHANIGYLYKTVGNDKKAAFNFEMAIKENAGETPRKMGMIYDSLASCYDRLNMVLEAEGSWQSGRVAEAAYPELLRNYAQFLVRRKMDKKKAVELYEKYLEYAPDARDRIAIVEAVATLKKK